MDVGKTRPSFILLISSVLLFSTLVDFSLLILAEDTLPAGRSFSGKRTLISQGGEFELGFFTPATSHKFYLGIWYRNISEKTYVWVANRDKPLLDATSELRLFETGNLALFGSSTEYPIWSTNSTSTRSNSTVAVLLDTGNLVLRDQSNPHFVIWQSFDHPADTWLPGGRVGSNKVTGEKITLISWITSEDPAYGQYSFGINATEAVQLQTLWNHYIPYWNSGNWNGQTFALSPELGNAYDFNYITNENESYFTYSVTDSSLISRIVLNSSGQIMHWIWNEGSNQWESNWWQPRNPCDVYSACGVYSSCDESTKAAKCRCLDGFDPKYGLDWFVNNRTGGCVRRMPLQCETKGEDGGFFSISGVTQLPTNSEPFETVSALECESACLNRCNCTAYFYNGGCLIWHGDLLNTQQQLTSSVSNNTDLKIRLAAAQLKDFQDLEKKRKKQKPLFSSKQRKQLFITVGVNGGLTLLLVGFFVGYIRRKKFKIKGRSSSTNHDLQRFDPTKRSSEMLDLGMKKGHNLPLFSFTSVAAATDNFFAENRLGQGGFGPVYKGKLLNGQKVAVKRLSRSSIQGLEEFQNEVTLVSELQHVNLVKLVGCCIEEEEKILIYEYMGNRSLDFFLFDSTNKVPLNWSRRKHIIEGIAQGLLYLHKYSRLRIIHRDLKASNILLDDDMNPKISDFGMARIHAGNESRANTKRVVGTFGYMAPEYAVEGTFSVKSDVFSFGVLLLEIITGKRATSFYQPDHYSNLLDYAWEFWKKGRCSELMDPVLSDGPAQVQLVRYINVSLLCVQEHASDRPVMSEVIYMLSNENLALPKPKGPAYVVRTVNAKMDPSPSRPLPCSLNNVTVSEMQAR